MKVVKWIQSYCDRSVNFLFICLRPTEPGNFTHITFLISISPKPETNNPRSNLYH